MNLTYQNSVPHQTRSPHIEHAARQALSSHTGRTLTDAEWARARNNLVRFVRILRSWEWAEKTKRLGMGEATAMQKVGAMTLPGDCERQSDLALRYVIR